MGTLLYGEEGENPSVKRFYNGEKEGTKYNVCVNKVMTKREFALFLAKCVEGLDL